LRKRGRQGATPMLAGVVAVVDIVRASCRRRVAGEVAMVTELCQLLELCYYIIENVCVVLCFEHWIEVVNNRLPW
jgi:hypothetical protein